MPGTNLLTPDEKGENFTSTLSFAFGLNAVDKAVGLGPYLSEKIAKKSVFEEEYYHRKESLKLTRHRLI